MRKIVVALLIGAVAFALVLFVTSRPQSVAPEVQAGPGYAQPSTGRYWAQRDQGEGGVEIEVIYVTSEFLRSGGSVQAQRYQPDRYAVFLVSMNTHSVDLLQYDMVKVSEVKAGGKTVTPLRWESTSDNNHHRSGVLIFPKVDPPLELVIKTVAGVPVRTFRWAP